MLYQREGDRRETYREEGGGRGRDNCKGEDLENSHQGMGFRGQEDKSAQGEQ